MALAEGELVFVDGLDRAIGDGVSGAVIIGVGDDLGFIVGIDGEDVAVGAGAKAAADAEILVNFEFLHEM